MYGLMLGGIIGSTIGQRQSVITSLGGALLGFIMGAALDVARYLALRN
jgi:outer membrane lipoprotein SlyB